MALFLRPVLEKYFSGMIETGKQFVNEKADWMEYFNQQKTKAEELKSQIAPNDSEIDGMVYYLTEEEIAVVKEDN